MCFILIYQKKIKKCINTNNNNNNKIIYVVGNLKANFFIKIFFLIKMLKDRNRYYSYLINSNLERFINNVSNL
mgnify:CR=1 FL=1